MLSMNRVFFICGFLMLIMVQNVSIAQYFNVTESTWNTQYKQGKWDYLETVSIERARNAVISVFADKYAHNGSLLDVGCGSGVLHMHLAPDQQSKYVGIDVSADAITIAKRQYPQGHYMTATLEAFRTPVEQPTFDVIVFNEVLYYVQHKIVIEQYMKYLSRHHGIIIISNFFKKNVNVIKDSIMADAGSLMVSKDMIILQGQTKYFTNHKKLSPVSFHVEVFGLKET